MVKRRISSEDISSDEDYSAAASPPLKASKASKAKQLPKKKKVKTAPSDDEVDLQVAVTNKARSHSALVHRIIDPVPVRVSLLEWYGRVHETRGMPWRKPYDASLGRDARAQRAYEVWISEIMLQQTQVATVIPYYNKWMEKFPTIRDLAASDIETVNSLWKGLGYYSRAARLLAGAQKAVKEYKGRLPDNAKEMEANIPGIGRYSAGAICSIAYGECVPVLDGNVNRLLSRVLALHANPKAKATLDILWAGATGMVESADRPGDINQALIELGSTVCKPREPVCGDCPVRGWCKAYELSKAKRPGADVPDIEEMCTLCEPLPLPEGNPGLVTVFPMKVERKKAREELDIVNVIEWRDATNRWFLLVRRPEGGLLAGLHEFPTLANVSGTAASASAQAKVPNTLLNDLLKSPPAAYTPSNFFAPKAKPENSKIDSVLKIKKIKPVGDVIHVFSHIKKTYRVQWVVLEGGGVEPPELVPSVVQQPAKKSTKGKQKTSRKSNRSDCEDEGDVDELGSLPVTAKWTPHADVTDTNIGTGVLKVWNLAKTLWDK